ncbi:MAG: TonB family protein [Bdellovibrionales bacterium]
MKLDLELEQQIAQARWNSSVLSSRKPTSRFVIGSILVHILSASAILQLGPLPQPEPTIIEVDLGSAPIAEQASAPVIAPEPQQAAPAVMPEPALAPAPVQTAEHVVAQKPAQVAKVVPIVAPVVDSAPQTASPPSPVAESAPAAQETTPATLDDIETPTLDDSEVVAAVGQKQDSKVSKDEIEKKLSEAQKAEAEKAALLAQNLEADTTAAESSLNQEMNTLESNVAEENAALAAQTQARTEAMKSELAAAQQAQAEQTSSPENGAGSAAQRAGPGTVGELRSLDQLRQMPGNPRPQYSPEERLKGQAGAVIFKAFVTKEGLLQEFQMLQSSGHRNLDFKTLKALKQWKFYPGQQGWVELPFKWDLKGGPQEMPTLLRRRVSQQN